MGPDAEYPVRNVIGIAEAHPEIGKSVVRNRHLGAQMLNIVSGKATFDKKTALGFSFNYDEIVKDSNLKYVFNLISIFILKRIFFVDLIFELFLVYPIDKTPLLNPLGDWQY